VVDLVMRLASVAFEVRELAVDLREISGATGS
jgi:hypothetical protein